MIVMIMKVIIMKVSVIEIMKIECDRDNESDNEN